MILNDVTYILNKKGHKVKIVTFICDGCRGTKLVPYYSYKNKKTHICKSCEAKTRKNKHRLGVAPANIQIKCITNCFYCQKLTKPKSKAMSLKFPHSFCNSSCQVKWQNQNTQFNKGLNNPSYKHGERIGGKLANYGDGFNSTVKRQVKIRDGFNCQECNKNFSGLKAKFLDVHHKDRNKYNNTLDNLVCLCKSCHTKIHWAED